MIHRTSRNTLLFSVVIFLLAAALCPFWGSVPLKWHEVFSNGFSSPNGQDTVIFFTIRLPRVLTALLSGAVLSCAGVVFQTVLRNPLACPYTLGIASGSALGAAITVLFPVPISFFGIPSISITAFIGAMLSLFLVLGISSVVQPLNKSNLILAGIAINFFCSSVIVLFFYISESPQMTNILHWLFGGLETTDVTSVKILFFSSFPPLILLFLLSRDLDILAAGDEFARTKGVSIERVTYISLITASFLTGSVVAHTGPIGFVGLLVPHILRPITGIHHRILLTVSIFSGGAFLAVCDTTARTLFSPAEFPVGIMTAFLGGPFFLFLIFRNKKNNPII